MGAEDAMEEDDDDVDFNPYLQLSPSLDGASGDSSEEEGEADEAEDDVELEVQEESLDTEDLRSSDRRGRDRETEMEKDLDEEDFLELGSDDYVEEDIEDDEQDDMVQYDVGNWKLGNYSSKSVSSEKDGKRVLGRRKLDKDESSNYRNDAEASDQETSGAKQDSEGDKSPFLNHSLGSNRILDGLQQEMETGSPAGSMRNLSELRVFRRGVQSGEILRGDNSEDIGDDEVDAISKRTRAHYSLADMSLEQLEMFLQESDEEEYFQNVDDEEEYRKFLLAVQEQQDGGSEQYELQGRKEDEDDEEEDADFELEIEEALESDYEDASGFTRKRKRRRPETRENRRQRTKAQNKGLHLSQPKAPLRPLLPHISNLTFGLGERRKITDGGNQVWTPTMKKKVPVNGFTAHQIGQLYCLIHEHVQLLVQVYSMSVLEPSRQQITNDTRRMLMELADKRDVLLSWKKTAFPDFCFRPPYTHPSFTEDEEATAAHRFQFSCDPTTPNLATCSGDNTGVSEAYPLGLDRDLVSWKSVSSGTLSSAGPSGQLNTLSISSPGGLMSLTCSVPGRTESTTFLRDHPSDISQLWHQPFSITQAPRAGLAKQREADRAYATDRFSESTIVQVGSCLGEGSLSGQTPVRSFPHVTRAHIPDLCSLATSSRAAQPLSGYGDEVAKQVNVTSEWAPATDGPVRSLLDVAPLALMREFLDDMSRVAENYRQRHVESGAYHSQCERGPLFTVPSADHHEGCFGRSSKPRTSALPLNGEGLPVPGPRMQIKKTMAAALVESTKKESLALVPKDVAQVVDRFLPLFNPALFPHKPPPIAAANRLLFTDAEDELLAMGLMMYNTDWTAIQQRFLPSKTMHQIFVRQKNRSSARAPENSIKAVRRMKSSPLTAVEKARIQEGLKIYKYDWHKVWEFCVPHRDPAVLPRQWRIALGTQKSYKTSETSKERRRVYEANRRQAKKAMEYGTDIKKDAGQCSIETGTEFRDVISGEEDGYDEGTYIRDAFLADWCPSKSPSVGASVPPPGGVHIHRSKTKSSVSKKRKPYVDQVPDKKPISSVHSLNLAPGPSAWLNRQALLLGANIAKQTVKLAPDLPSVKLPPHVHVLSQGLVPTLPAHSSNAGGESVTSRLSYITGKKWSRTTGPSTDRAVSVNPPQYFSSALLPKNGGKAVRQSSVRSNSRASIPPVGPVGVSPSQSTPQQNGLPVAKGAANSNVTATNVDLHRLAKDLDKRFGITQPTASVDLNRLHTSVRSPAEIIESNAPSIHALSYGETLSVFPQGSGHKIYPFPGAPPGSGSTSAAKSNRFSPRRRKGRVPVVSSSSSNIQRSSARIEAVFTGTQNCDLPQTSIPAVTPSTPSLARNWQIPDSLAHERLECTWVSTPELSSDDPLKITEAVTVGDAAHRLVADSPLDTRYPPARQKELQASTRGPLSKKKSAKRDRKLTTLEQSASRAMQNCNKQLRTESVPGKPEGQTDDCHTRENYFPTVHEASFTSEHRRKKQKSQETVETQVEDLSLEPQVIVMEQEELSDSEDEAGIGVEFEHEEMGDSDKDAELDLGVCNQVKESSIEFEEEEMESDKEGEEDVQEISKEGVVSTAEAPGDEILRRDTCSQVQSSRQDNVVRFWTKIPVNAGTMTEVPVDCTYSKSTGKTPVVREGKQAREGVKSKARMKSKDRQFNAGTSHQVQRGWGHALATNTRAREQKKIEAQNELESGMAGRNGKEGAVSSGCMLLNVTSVFSQFQERGGYCQSPSLLTCGFLKLPLLASSVFIIFMNFFLGIIWWNSRCGSTSFGSYSSDSCFISRLKGYSTGYFIREDRTLQNFKPRP